VNIPGVPDSIPRERVRELFAGLGIDIAQVTQAGIHVGWDSITATVFATDENGRRYVERSTSEIAVHHVRIHIKDGRQTEF
jgi:hypothetical protein